MAPADFNSYGARRGNHEVMMRGTFANIRLRNLLGGPAELPRAASRATCPTASRCRSTTPRCATRRRACRSSCSPARSTARARRATGPRRARALLGVRAVIAESFERIHRSNLVGMGVLPLQFRRRRERRVARPHRRGGVRDRRASPRRSPPASARDRRPCTADGRRFEVRVRIDTPMEVEYYRHGGILQYVLRQLLPAGAA